jgi:hypothetical protein
MASKRSLNKTIAQQVNRESDKIGAEFTSQLRGMPGVMICDDLRSANKVNAGVTTPEQTNVSISSSQNAE